MSLYQAFWDNQGGIINKWTHYFPIYERHFAPFRNRSLLFVEIGAGHGGSGQMWKRWFGPLAKIVSLDIRPECAGLEDEQVSVRIGDQSDPRFLNAIVDEFGPPDIVLDDGSHVVSHVRASFDTLFPRMAREAVYLIEDLHTAYWAEYGGGHRHPDSFIEYAKTLMDELHSRHSRGAVSPSPVSELIRGLHVYDSVVVLDKGPPASRSPVSRPPGAIY